MAAKSSSTACSKTAEYSRSSSGIPPLLSYYSYPQHIDQIIIAIFVYTFHVKQRLRPIKQLPVSISQLTVNMRTCVSAVRKSGCFRMSVKD